MKIFISANYIELKGSYGGGAFFVQNLYRYLKKKKWKITFELEKDIDLILVIDPRKRKLKKYSIDDIIKFQKKHPHVKIVYRVNECDIKRQVSINIEPLMVKTIKSSHHVIFVSQWLQNYFIDKYHLQPLQSKFSVILNGCNRQYFYPLSPEKLTNKISRMNEKIRLITHHCSNNYLKGFHIYNRLDQILPQHPEIEFTYVGNYINNYSPKKIKMIPPRDGIKLGDTLRKHHIYLTATQNEPGAMHYLEGMSCGLPVVYCSGGGGVAEICQPCGIEYQDISSLLNSINQIKQDYSSYINKIDYNYLGSNRCCDQYYQLFKNL